MFDFLIIELYIKMFTNALDLDPVSLTREEPVWGDLTVVNPLDLDPVSLTREELAWGYLTVVTSLDLDPVSLTGGGTCLGLSHSSNFSGP